MNLRRSLVLVVFLTGVAAVLTGLLWQVNGPSRKSPAPAGVEPPRVQPAGASERPSSALLILGEWDDQRATAYSRGSVAALRRLYTPGSGTGRRDQALLRSYADRGLRVVGMRTQVLAVDVRRESTDRLELAVTDRLAAGAAVGRSKRVELPRDRVSTRTIAMVRRQGRWVVSEVRG